MTNESVDQLIRQALAALPDTPPPEVPFEAEALWKNLHTELHPKPRWRGGWWVAAGVVLALIGVGAYVLAPVPAPPNARTLLAARSVGKVPPRQIRVPIAPVPRVEAAAIGRKLVPPRSRPTPGPLPEDVPRVAAAEPVSAETEPVPAAPEPLPVAEVAGGVPPATPSPVPLRPRFRVVHANELRAEEEARPKLYRSEAWVRFGYPTELGGGELPTIKPIIFSRKPN